MTNKKDALDRLTAIEKEAKELRKIIDKPKNVTDRIKTFGDAYDEFLNMGEDANNIDTLLSYNGINKDLIAAKAFLQLTIIAQALNEGWAPDWSDPNECKYYPYLKYKSGFGFSHSHCDDWFTTTGVGSRLCFKSSELAEYAGKQFESIYNQLFTL